MNTVQRGLIVLSAFCSGVYATLLFVLHQLSTTAYLNPPLQGYLNLSHFVAAACLVCLILWLVIDLHERTGYDIQSVLSDD